MGVVRVLYASAEFAPVSFVGGLASASAGLVRQLRRSGVEVEVVHPDYGGIPLAGGERVELDVPAWAGPAHARRGMHPDIGLLTLVAAPGLARPHPYLQPDGTGWPDNDRRFLSFSQAIAALVRRNPPDVLHLNDWHTAAALGALELAPPSVLSIHNLAYQGQCGREWLPRLGPRSGAYEQGLSCNPLAGGISLADAVIAVSPSYAAEIRTPELGMGLDALLRAKGALLTGIRNGIDVDLWDPRTDPLIARHFDVEHIGRKGANRKALRAELGLRQLKVPVGVMVTRLTEQKGVDLVLPLLELLPTLPMQLAVLGAGEAELVSGLQAASAAQPGLIAFVAGYDEGLSHRLFAGGDLLLMPSRFEACGLAQMQAMRYGTIPVVTDVGGLHDTVADADRSSRQGTGFVARSADTLHILDALHRAHRGWSDTARRRAIQQRGMTTDWSWEEPAQRYARVYRRLLRSASPAGSEVGAE